MTIGVTLYHPIDQKN